MFSILLQFLAHRTRLVDMPSQRPNRWLVCLLDINTYITLSSERYQWFFCFRGSRFGCAATELSFGASLRLLEEQIVPCLYSLSKTGPPVRLRVAGRRTALVYRRGRVRDFWTSWFSSFSSRVRIFFIRTGAETFLVFDESVVVLCKRSKTEPCFVASAFFGIFEGDFLGGRDNSSETSVIAMLSRWFEARDGTDSNEN